MINSKLKFYRDLQKSREQASSYPTPNQKKITELEKKIKISQKHFHSSIEKVNAAKKQIKELESDIKMLTYDNGNLKDEIKFLNVQNEDMAKQLGYVRKSYVEATKVAKSKY